MEFDSLRKDLETEFNNSKINGVVSVLVYGSYARGDAVSSWSDMDILIIMAEENISMESFRELKRINVSLSRKYKNIPLTFRMHSVDELPEYKRFESSICSYSLFSYFKDCIVIYGLDVRQDIKNIIEKIGIDMVIGDLRSKIISSRHESRSLITSSNEIKPFTQSFHVDVKTLDHKRYKLSRFIDLVLECAMCCNIIKGAFPTKKNEIAKKFKEIFPDFKYYELPMKYCKIRNQWNSKLDISEDLFEDCCDFLEKLPGLFESNIRYNQINNAFDGLLINDTNSLYRKNVCAIIINENKEFLIVEKDNSEWQFVQGGVENNETLLSAIKREIIEEIGVTDYEILCESNYINQFDWPDELQKKKGFKGQEQHFFIVLEKKIQEIVLQKDELFNYRWVKLRNIKKFIKREDLVESFDYIIKEFPNLLK
ncbi:MAG TPA: NUDIX domain-containing protein [Candidatus Nanoarchaeia archaeon]|nr:NUDIX domain-containing protein [Candidatus Nanoarchaeia archaeon]